MSETDERLVNAIDALSASVADRDARIATLEALLAERPAPADPALLALAKLGASLLDRAWVEQVGFFDDSTLQDDLDRAAVAFGLVRYESPGNFQMAPGIADAIAALLAPDGAASEGVTG